MDAAVAEGRKELYSSKQAEWATPVLYLRSKDGMLFAPASDDPPVTGAAPVSRAAQGLRAPTAPAAANDPWGAALETPSVSSSPHPTRTWKRSTGNSPRHSRRLDWVRVVDSVPRDDRQQHDAAVDGLVRRADLSRASAGRQSGPAAGRRRSPDTLKTYQLEQLSIGLKAARSQLVVMTSEDKDEHR